MTVRILKPEGMESWLRIADSPIGPVIPVLDIAKMIGYSRSGIDSAIEGFKEKMSPYKTYVSLPTPGGQQQFLCLNRTGVDYLFLIIHPSKSKLPLDQLLDLRKIALEKMDADRETAAPSLGPAVLTIEAEMNRARNLAGLTGGDLKAFQAVALKKCGMPEYIEALKAPCLIHGEGGTWLNPTQLGERCGLNAREVNSYLYNHGYQYPEGPVWRLQPKGDEFGEEYWFEATSGHREIRIRWRESILFASGLKRQPETGYPALSAPVEG